MSPRFFKLSPIALSEPKYFHQGSFRQKPSQSEFQEKFNIEKANIYNKKWLEEKNIPTAIEFTTHKNFVSPTEYQKIQADPNYQKARNMAYIHQFLFDISYLPFIKIPFRDYNGNG